MRDNGVEMEDNAPSPSERNRRSSSAPVLTRDHVEAAQSLKAIGVRPAGFAIMAELRKANKKHRSNRRLMQAIEQRRTSLRVSDLSEASSLLRGPENSIREEHNFEEFKDELEDEDLNGIKGPMIDMIFGKPISILLIFMPFALMAHYLKWSPAAIFWLNFFAMVPLASILGDFTEEVAAHTNETIGGLVNATFGNAVEVVVAIQALLHHEIRVVQASMIGSIFSNLLLVLGGCFFFGGMKHKEQTFNSTAATANMGLLALSTFSLVLPTPFAEYYEITDEHVLSVSRIAAIFLMSMYVQLLVFQLRTHTHLFDDEENGEMARIPLSLALGSLLGVTLMIAVFSDFLVQSIDAYCESSGISRTFVGLIILPIVGNAVEHMTAISVAMKDKMDLAMGVAVGSCVQISLFVVPLTVLVGWAFDRDMTLNFPHFEIMLYILSVVTVSICLANPKSNWLEGSLLMTTYTMIAVGFWYENVLNY